MEVGSEVLGFEGGVGGYLEEVGMGGGGVGEEEVEGCVDEVAEVPHSSSFHIVIFASCGAFTMAIAVFHPISLDTSKP